MVKVKVIEDFRLGRFNEVKNLVRANPSKNAAGYLYKNDVFECEKDLADYLIKNNPLKRAFIQIIELVPEKKQETKKTVKKEDVEAKPKRTTTRRKRTVAKK